MTVQTSASQPQRCGGTLVDSWAPFALVIVQPFVPCTTVLSELLLHFTLLLHDCLPVPAAVC
jgi:hypothetical protein